MGEKLLGFVHFDRSGISNNRTEILVSRDKIERLIRNKYVKITNPKNEAGETVEFLGRIVEGPFYLPEEVGRDSALAQTSILKGESFPNVPNYYAVGGTEILGELKGNKVYGVNTRPAPQAKVEELSSSEVKSLLSISGDLLLGKLDGYPDIDIYLRSDEKKVIPRNIGIFGTVGSGKTNTAQVLIEEASEAKYATVVVDVEGEYVDMDKGTEELVDLLKSYKKSGKDIAYEPKGIEDFHVYHLVGTETERKDKKKPFTLVSSDLDEFLLSEIIEAEEAQQRRLFTILDELRKGKKVEKKSSSERSLKSLVSRDREFPYTLTDIIRSAAAKADDAKGADKYSYWALQGKLGRLNRTGAFDVPGEEPINAKELVVPGRVSIFDVSYCSDILKNLVIADLLRRIFDEKKSNEDAPPTLLIIEEAHSFISREKIGKMQETIEKVREIARRGRKRWLGLCFISQQPSHLPNELFELCNTRIVHNIKSQANLNSLKLTAGDVSEEMWNNVPSLGTGQAVVSSPQLRDPIVINVRPCKTKRKFIE